MTTGSASTGLAIFVKTPGTSAVKTRLAATIGQEAATEFYRLSAAAVAAVARAAAVTLPIQPYWAVAEPEALDDPVWQGLPTIAQGDGDLGARMRTVCETLLTRHGRAVLLGADAPQIQADDLSNTVAALDTHDHVLGPAADGGFWLFGTRGPVADAAWERTPWSHAATAEHFAGHLEHPTARLRTLRDVDTAADLACSLTALERGADGLPEQQRLREWLQNNLP